MQAAQAGHRKQKDLMKLMLSKYDVKIEGEKENEFLVVFVGPKDSPYEGVIRCTRTRN